MTDIILNAENTFAHTCPGCRRILQITSETKEGKTVHLAIASQTDNGEIKCRCGIKLKWNGKQFEVIEVN